MIKSFNDFINEKDHSGELGSYTKTFVEDWTYGLTTAVNLLSYASVKTDLKKTLELDEYVLYRGFKILDEDKVKKIFGKEPGDLKPGKIKISITEGPTSWTDDIEVAKKFANVYYDSFKYRWLSYNQLTNMGL